jgi:adenosylcobinamide-phosphate synthase
MDEQHIALILGLWIGLSLDFWLADPPWLPHPVVGFGRLIAVGEQWLNKARVRLLKGALLAIGLVAIVFAGFYGLQLWLSEFHPGFSIAFNSMVVFYCLANKGLILEGKAVFDVLEKQGLKAAQKQLGRIVGRETERLDANQVRTGALESMSENLSDGVVAPLFYYALLGPAGMMAYKMASTLDSMIGYKNERYNQFGKFAARLDDLLNYIPARLTVLFIFLVSFNKKVLRYAHKYGKCHSSPNAGYPEAALSGVLDCRFGGPNWYHGELINKPFIGENDRELTHQDLNTTVQINTKVTLLLTALVSVAWWVV